MTIADEIAALRAKAVPELITYYENLFGKPPRSRHHAWLWKRCAFKLQENAFGGLSRVAKDAIDRLGSDLQLPAAGGRQPLPPAAEPPRPRSDAQPGTVITRLWRGQEIRVEFHDNGFVCNGATYRSLSAVANAVTGQHLNGRAFFKMERKETTA